MKKISNTLVRKVFTSYFAVAALITFIHLGVQFYDEEERVIEQLNDYRSMTYSALGTGLWNFDKPALVASLEGVIEAPLICRATAQAPKSFNSDVLADVQSSSCAVSQDQLRPFRFSVTYRSDDNAPADVGVATFYYNSQFALANTVDRAFLIISLSLLKTAILGLIIVFWARRLVKDPLEQITSFCGTLSEKDHHDYHAQIHSNDEIQELERSFIKLLDKVKSLSLESQAKSVFLSNISHELRTPLNAVIGYSQMLIEDLDIGERPSDESIKDDLRNIESSGSHLLTLINEVLDLAKVESGRVDLSFDRVVPQDLVKQVAVLIAPMMEKRKNKFNIKIDESVESLYTDESRLKQILLNLLSNAAKYTDNGSVALEVESAEVGMAPGIVFLVRDSGQGIADHDLNKVFDRFVQVHDTKADEYSGTGIGLALSRSLARMMGGDLTVSSTLGKGSCFRLVVPHRTQTPEDHQDTEFSSRVLVLDDDGDTLDLVYLMLKDVCNVETARTLSDALTILKDSEIDLLYLDLHMPGLDGLKALAEIRQCGLCPQNVYLLTGTSIPNYLIKAKSIGIDGIIMKPFSRDKLLETFLKQSNAS